MRRNRIIALVASIVLILVVVLSGCGTAQIEPTSTPTATPTYTGPTPTPRVEIRTVEVEKEYRVLNPEGIFIPVEIVPLAPRLDTINGKTIYIWQGESDPVVMPGLHTVLKANYPNTNWVYIAVSGFGASRPEDEVLENADAAIRGNGW